MQMVRNVLYVVNAVFLALLAGCRAALLPLGPRDPLSVEFLDYYVTEKTASVMVEVVQGEGGIRALVAPAASLRELEARIKSVLRRTKSAVLSELPPRTELTFWASRSLSVGSSMGRMLTWNSLAPLIGLP